ncbi:MAG: glycosyltransferase [Janthinobacterium lividum]
MREAMLMVGARAVSVLENALDQQTLSIAQSLAGDRAARVGPGQQRVVRIVYGSGTRTHDADFRVAAAAIHRLLKQRPDARLCIAGELNLPSFFTDVQAQIERLPLVDYPSYLAWLARGDISIAPLEPGIFNDAKSNIKFLEAAVVGMPSVCSPRASFRNAIEDGLSGFLVDSEQTWFEVLLRLVDDADLRARVGRQAHDVAVRRYAPESIAANQLSPLIAPFDSRRHALRVLAVNVNFAPRSFGGATILAEELAQRLNHLTDVDYAMFTSVPTDGVPAYELVRYEAKSTTAFGMGLPPYLGMQLRSFENDAVIDAFREAVRAFRPAVVHLHSIQGISASVVAVCREEAIPYVITLHDAWWICARQFMITDKRRYCQQTTIDLRVCATCVPDADLNEYRQNMLGEILNGANRLLAPSEFFRKLYLANGVDPARIVVNRNGILPPRKSAAAGGRRHDGALRLGYVGGNTDIKGIHIIKAALSGLSRADYRLILVDNMMNLGQRSIHMKEWKALAGEVEIVPAYRQESIDDFFEGIDVLLFPTQWKESFGLTVREALIRDIWVIATDAGGVVEDIVDGENGTIVPLLDNGTALRAAIVALLDDPQRLAHHENPHKSRIRLIDDQVSELRDLLEEVVR